MPARISRGRWWVPLERASNARPYTINSLRLIIRPADQVIHRDLEYIRHPPKDGRRRLPLPCLIAAVGYLQLLSMLYRQLPALW